MPAVGTAGASTYAYVSAENYFADEQPHGQTVLELRDILTGHLVRTLLTCRTNVGLNVARASDGSIFVATTKNCSSDVERLDPKTGRLNRVRHVPQPIFGLSLDPKADRIAFMTYPTCGPLPRGGFGPGGEGRANPSVLSILDLATGQRSSAATPNPGNPLTGLSWSPDGSSIASGYFAPTGRSLLMIFKADDLSFSTARIVNSPTGCAYGIPAWITSDLIVDKDCGKPNDPSPDELVRIDLSGKILRTWRLPSCINGLGTLSDPSSRTVLVTMDIGYGVGPPCEPPSNQAGLYRVAAVTGDVLQTMQNTVLMRGAQDFGPVLSW